jgi:hypothetical protein
MYGVNQPIGDDEIYDYIDIDCADCGIKFIVAPLSAEAEKSGRKYPTQCGRCRKGLAPLWEY